MHEREQSHAAASHESTTHDEDAKQQSRHSSTLNAPEHPIASGLLMRKADGNGVHDDAEGAVAAASQSSGFSLPTAIMRKFEGSLGADLSSVRLHTGAESAAAAGAVGARAYTIGQDIHFAAGQYDPSSAGGEHLLAHEVAHTVQQQGGTPTRQNKLEVSTPFDSAEHEADRAADAMVTGASATIAGSSFAGAQRQQAPAAEQKPTNQLSPADQAQLQATLENIASSYSYILLKQRDGIDALQKALDTPDPPSFTETALSFVIQAALGAAFGALGGMVGAAVGKYASAAAKPLVAAAAGAAMNSKDGYVPPGMTAGEVSGATDMAAKIAAGLAKKIEDAIKGGFGALATKAAADVKGQSPIPQFVTGQKTALTDAAKKASETFRTHKADFPATTDGLAAALGLKQALDEAYAQAASEQLMASLVEWSKVLNTSNGRESGMICVDCTMDSPTGAPAGFKSTWQGVTQAARKIVTESYSSKVVGSVGAMMQIKIKSKDTYIFITSRGGGDVKHPTSGHEAAFLIQKAGGDPQKADENLTRVGAYLLLNEISSKTFADIKLATD